MKKVKRLSTARSRGFSLIEVMVAMGILGLVSYFLVSMLRNGSLGQKTLIAQDDARVLNNDIVALLTNPVACANTFGGISKSPNSLPVDPTQGNGVSVENIVDANLKPQFTIGKVYGNRSLKLSAIVIGGAGVDAKSNLQKWTPGASAGTGTAFVQLSWSQTGNQISGPQTLTRYFLVFANKLNDKNQIESCSAVAGGNAASSVLASYYTLIIDENTTNTQPSQFKGSIIDMYPSYGGIHISGGSSNSQATQVPWGSLLFKMNITADSPTVVTQYLTYVDDDVYFYLNGALIQSVRGWGGKYTPVTWNFTTGLNSIEIVLNNNLLYQSELDVFGNFFVSNPSLHFSP